MKILYIGKFKKLWDEEYIAQAFESLGHDVIRLPETHKKPTDVIAEYKPDLVLWAKLNINNPMSVVNYCKQNNIKTVCWVWDLYWGYAREHQIHTNLMFKADYVFTSDGGHQNEWESVGIKHKCIRQGIHEPECYLEPGEKLYDVVFIGSQNQFNAERLKIINQVKKDFNFKWFGKENEDEIRGPKLNRLFCQSKIIIGDSVYSPNYWSNRVVETLGRGGFLIHVDVPGIKEEYPYLVTYEKGNYEDLKQKINHYLQNPNLREEIIKKNHEWVKNNYTCKHKCQELCQNL